MNWVDKVFKLAITGGPCAGKSTLMSGLKANLEAAGYHVAVAPEAATILLENGFKMRELIDEPQSAWIMHQVELIRVQIALEEAMKTSLEEMVFHRGGKAVLLCDRGIRDNKVYMTDHQWSRVLRIVEPMVTFERYHGVLHLQSAAVGAPEHYKNTVARTETVKEAAQLEEATLGAWFGHHNRRVINNADDGFGGKVMRAVAAARELIG